MFPASNFKKLQVMSLAKEGCVKTGLDRLRGGGFAGIQEEDVGLVANHTACTRDLEFILDAFRREGGKRVRVIFSPEHGLMGDVADAVKVDSYFDDELNVHVFSLYGKTYEPPISLVREVEALVYDIQDVGARWYTYISTLYYSIRAASRAGVAMYVLDRPNPVTGIRIEGPILEPEYKSFVGIHEIPVRYGLTPGELALLFNEEENLGADIKVIRMENWRREMWFDSTGLPWIPPSPNIPTLNSAIVYLGTCLVEGVNMSEGRGTPKPFEYVGAPWIRPTVLARKLRELSLEGAGFRPVYFRPCTSKYSGERCGGVHVHVLDRDLFRPLRVALSIIKAVRELYPGKFEWRTIDGRCWFDQLIGNRYVREMIEDGSSLEDIERAWAGDTARFEERAGRYFLYT